MNNLINQPLLLNQFLPDIRFFSAYYQGNRTIVFDPLWEKQYFFNRAYLLDHGRIVKLSVPVHVHEKGVFPDHTQDWSRIHLGTIKAAYGKSGYFEYLVPLWEDIIVNQSAQIWDINKAFIELSLKVMRLPLPQWVFRNDQNLNYEVIRWPDHLKSISHDNFSDLQQGNFLVNNLSTVHALFHHGPAAINFLQPHSVI